MFKKIIILSIFSFCVMFSANAGYGQKAVTSAQINGTWRDVTSKPAGVTSEFKIFALGGQKLQMRFTGNNAAKQFSDTADGTAMIEGATAVFQPEENQINADAPCVITLKFSATRLIVTEKGECGWGAGIGAAGTYKKISSKKAFVRRIIFLKSD